jgi:hypothetical protein
MPAAQEYVLCLVIKEFGLQINALSLRHMRAYVLMWRIPAYAGLLYMILDYRGSTGKKLESQGALTY